MMIKHASSKALLHDITHFCNGLIDNRAEGILSHSELVIECEKHVYGEVATHMKPKHSIIGLSHRGKVSVSYFDFMSSVHDLLIKAENNERHFIFDFSKNDPFDLDFNNMNSFGDIQTSVWYKQTHSKMRIIDGTEILCPVYLYIDGLTIDAYGKLSSEPVTMSLGLFNRNYRYSESAWKVLGYLPNFDRLYGSSSKDPSAKANDYHKALSVILRDMKVAMKSNTGYWWNFQSKVNDSRNLKRRLRFALHFIIGDTKGNDMLAGRYASHTTTYLCRDCDCKLADADDPYVSCNFLVQSELDKLDENDLKNKFSFRKIDHHAFRDVNFGANPYGINAAAPPEPLHVFLLGLMKRLNEALYLRFNSNSLLLLDKISGYVATSLSRNQSDRTLPPVAAFCNGLTEAKRLTGKEIVGKCLIIYLSLRSTEMRDFVVGSKARPPKKKNSDKAKEKARENDERNEPIDEEFIKVIDEKEYHAWVSLYEDTLCFEKWLRLEHHPSGSLRGGRHSLVARRCSQYLSDFKEVARRDTGMGLKIPKFHHMTHWWWVILLCGCLLNVDGGRNESIAKTQTKQNVKATQRRHVSLNIQTSLKYYEYCLFIHAIALACLHTHVVIRDYAPAIATTNVLSVANHANDVGGEYRGTFWIRFDEHGISVGDYSLKNGIFKGTDKIPMDNACANAIHEKLYGYNGGTVGRTIKYVMGFTEYPLPADSGNPVGKVNIARAHPRYRGGTPWNDWVKVHWEEVGLLEARILCFLDINTAIYDSHVNSNLDLEVPSELVCNSVDHLVALIHSCAGEERRDRNVNLAFSYTKITRKRVMEDEFQLIPCSSIRKKACCFVEFTDVNTSRQNQPKAIVSLDGVEGWANHFLDYAVIPTETNHAGGNERVNEVFLTNMEREQAFYEHY